MKKALFLLLPTKSHYISCLEFAKELKNRDYIVYFAGVKDLEEYIVNNNFEFILFRYMSTYKINSIKSFFGTLLKSTFDNSFRENRYEEFLDYIKHAQDLYTDLNPDIIFIDEHVSHYFFYFINFSDNIYIINTKLLTKRVKGIPPLNSSYVPHGNFISDIICEFIWFKYLLVKRFVFFINDIAFLNESNEIFYRNYVKSLNCSYQLSDETSMYDYDIIIETKLIILMSLEFDFPWQKKEICALYFNYLNMASDANLKIPDFLKWITCTDKPIIYCSIGTMSGNNPHLYVSFLLQLILAFRYKDDYFLIISTGSEVISSKLSNIKLPSHIYICNFLPQTLILPYCKIMITHGGLNSIKESIASTVPMLGIINPQHKHTDTRGNIARIKYHKLGLSCCITSKNRVIYRKIKNILSNDDLKKNVKP